MGKYYLGIDASKGYADFIILNSKKKTVVNNFQMDDTFDGHSRLYTKLKKFLEAHPESIIYTAIESTGGYENNWYNTLLAFQGSLNIQTARLNPLGVHHNSKADLKRNKTDKISATSIGEYMIAHSEKVSYQQQDSLASLRKQWSFVRMLTKQCTQLLNQLESLIYSGNPEILIYCKDSTPEWILKLLTKYPTAHNLARAKMASLAKIPYVSSARAEDLVANAKKSIASTTDKITQQLIVSTVNQIMHLKKTIKVQTAIMAKECSVPEVELLKTFVGISDHSAIGLMLEIQSVKRFKTVKKLASFFGLHPELKLSGDGVAAFHMSKKGRKEPRQILFMVAMGAITTNPLIRTIYEERVEKGMKKMAALGLCMHKILRIIYGMLKNNQAFNPEIDLKNRAKAYKRKSKPRNDKNRRYQDYDSKAPISRRQYLKRMEQKQSHSANNGTRIGIIAPVPFPT
ncbi:IS110 family transposase [Thermodesulfobacteriota bacterium]